MKLEIQTLVGQQVQLEQYMHFQAFYYLLMASMFSREMTYQHYPVLQWLRYLDTILFLDSIGMMDGED